jgi:hypothetical protein
MISLCSCVNGQCNCPIPEIADIYNRNKGRVIHSIADVLDLADLVKIDINAIKRIPYAPYWDFLTEVASNIETGKWAMHPYMWKKYILNATYLPLPEKAIDEREKALREKCQNILRGMNVSVNSPDANKQLLLKWFRNPNGFQDVMSTVKTMIELNNLFTGKEK